MDQDNPNGETKEAGKPYDEGRSKASAEARAIEAKRTQERERKVDRWLDEIQQKTKQEKGQ